MNPGKEVKTMPTKTSTAQAKAKKAAERIKKGLEKALKLIIKGAVSTSRF